MNPTLRNILAVIAGVVIGGSLNMAIIMVSGYVIPPPDGADLKTMEGLKAAMHLMQAKHFIMPFLAHALGTFAGAGLAALLAATYKTRFAIGVSAWFLLGGIMNVFMLPSPTWFTALDLICAYLPMGYLAAKLVERGKR